VNGWRVCLSVRSTTRTPDDLTRELGPGTTSSARNRRWPHLWELDSGLHYAELDEHLNALVERCRDKVPAIAAIAGDPTSNVAIEAVLHAGDSLPSMWIPPGAVRFAADCGIGIDIDGYLG
jgi:hypothetical protein